MACIIPSDTVSLCHGWPCWVHYDLGSCCLKKQLQQWWKHLQMDWMIEGQCITFHTLANASNVSWCSAILQYYKCLAFKLSVFHFSFVQVLWVPFASPCWHTSRHAAPMCYKVLSLKAYRTDSMQSKKWSTCKILCKSIRHSRQQMTFSV